MAKAKQPKVWYGEEHLPKLGDDPTAYLDLETSGLSPYRDKIAVVTVFSPRTDTVVVCHPRGKALSRRMKDYVSSRKLLVGHNLAGFDLLFLRRAGVDVFRPKVYDTMLAESAILTSDRRDVHVSLKSTLARRTGKHISKDQDHSGWMNPRLTESQLQYCVNDVRLLASLKAAQEERADPEQLNAIGLECDLVPAIVQMSLNGMPLSRPRLEGYIKALGKNIPRLRRDICAVLGAISLSSPVQVKRALNEWLTEHDDLPLSSTSAEVLQDQVLLGGEFGELCGKLLEHRHAEKRMKMYSPSWMDKYIVDGLVHPHWWSTKTDTMRFSCSDPNLQQVPRDMRSVFGGVPGHKMVKCDLQQAEVRMMAAVCDCAGLKEAFKKGLHIHTDIGSKAFHMPYDEVPTRDGGVYKQLAKALTFTIIFFGGVETFQTACRRAGIKLGEEECRKIFDDFFAAYPEILAVKRDAQRRAYGRVTTIRLPSGAKRVLFGAKNAPSKIINTQVQGGAAAGMKFGMLEAYRRGLFPHICATVHDELVGCVPTKEAEDFAVELSESMNVGMEQVMGDVPSACEWKIGDYWS